MSTHAREISEAGFNDDVIAASKKRPVVVDFWAEWCGPCRALAPVLEEAIAARGDQVELVKLNIDHAPEVANQYSIRGIPAVKAFRDGRVVDEFVGVLPRSQIEAFLDRVCPSAEEQTLAQAIASLQAQDVDQAISTASALLDTPRYHDQAQLLIARAEYSRADIDAACAALATIHAQSEVADQASAVGLRIELRRGNRGAP